MGLALTPSSSTDLMLCVRISFPSDLRAISPSPGVTCWINTSRLCVCVYACVYIYLTSHVGRVTPRQSTLLPPPSHPTSPPPPVLSMPSLCKCNRIGIISYIPPTPHPHPFSSHQQRHQHNNSPVVFPFQNVRWRRFDVIFVLHKETGLL